MSVSSARTSEKRKFSDSVDIKDEVNCDDAFKDSHGRGKTPMELDKRLRREIANSNERKRMQSINAGFQTLRFLLPKHDGEKLSKAAILQQTADYIYQLKQENSNLVRQNAELKRISSHPSEISACSSSSQSSPHSPSTDPPPAIIKRRKTMDGAVESADEGIGSMSPDHSVSNEDCRAEVSELRREIIELRSQLDREQRHRISLEEHIGVLTQQHQQYLVQPNVNAERMQSGEEVENVQPVACPTRIIVEETPRNSLETIVEAIRHLEGDHLFSDDRSNTQQATVSSPSSSPSRPMEVCSSSGNSPLHAQTYSINEAPIALTSHSLSQPACVVTLPAQPAQAVTSLKHHVLNRIARGPDVEDQPINLEFRPTTSRSPSPFPVNTSLPFQLHVQQQQAQTQQARPGVIVVKHS